MQHYPCNWTFFDIKDPLLIGYSYLLKILVICDCGNIDFSLNLISCYAFFFSKHIYVVDLNYIFGIVCHTNYIDSEACTNIKCQLNAVIFV